MEGLGACRIDAPWALHTDMPMQQLWLKCGLLLRMFAPGAKAFGILTRRGNEPCVCSCMVSGVVLHEQEDEHGAKKWEQPDDQQLKCFLSARVGMRKEQLRGHEYLDRANDEAADDQCFYVGE